jgi:uncharacterized membrane protein
MNRRTIYLVGVLMCVAPLVYLALSWQGLPASVPLHFGLDGKADRFGDKGELIVAVSVIIVIGFGSFLLLMNIHKIDPKKAKNSPAVMAKIALAVLTMITLIQFMIIDSAVTGTIKFSRFLLPVMGLFFAFLGNLFYSVKPNYFVGIRTPWALESEDNWRKTHQLAAKLWFAGGFVAALLTLLLPFQMGMFVFLGITFTMVIIPFVYSYKLYKKSKLDNSSI